MEYLISEEKITFYLLTYPSKSRFFLSVGYSVEDWPRLRRDLLRIAENFPGTLRRTTPYGDEFEIVGEVQAPDGRVIKLRTGWMKRKNEADILSFVTAYPA